METADSAVGEVVPNPGRVNAPSDGSPSFMELLDTYSKQAGSQVLFHWRVKIILQIVLQRSLKGKFMLPC